MRRTSKLFITLMTFVVATSLISQVYGYDLQYETVGGEVAPINFITTFLVPALVMVGIFGAMIAFGVIRISFKSDVTESA